GSVTGVACRFRAFSRAPRPGQGKTIRRPRFSLAPPAAARSHDRMPHPRDKVRLLFGPYTPPPLRRGDRTTCLYRGTDVVVRGASRIRSRWAGAAAERGELPSRAIDATRSPSVLYKYRALHRARSTQGRPHFPTCTALTRERGQH